MSKKVTLLVPILLLAVLALVGAGCGQEKTSKGTAPSGQEVADQKVTEKSDQESLANLLSKAKDVTSLKYDAVMTIPGHSPMTQKIYLKGHKFRTEMDSEGQNVVYLMDLDEQISYLYIPSQKMAMKMDFAQAQERAGKTPQEESKGILTQEGLVVVGSEVFDGKDCLVVEYESEENVKAKMWIWEKYGICVKAEIATSEGTMTTEYKNIEFGNIPDSMFELPADVQVTEMPGF